MGLRENEKPGPSSLEEEVYHHRLDSWKPETCAPICTIKFILDEMEYLLMLTPIILLSLIMDKKFI